MNELEIGLVAVAILAYPLLLYRLMTFYQSSRLELAERGERLLLRSDLGERDRIAITEMLETAYSGWVMMRAIIILPVLAIYLAVNSKARYRGASQIQSRTDEVNREIKKIRALFLESTFAANPICGLFFAFERIILLAVIFAVGKSREAVRAFEGESIGETLRTDAKVVHAVGSLLAAKPAH